MVVGNKPVVVIGEYTPVTLPSGMVYVPPFEKEVGPTNPTALVEPPNVIQFPAHIVPPLPALTVGMGLTVTVCVIAF